MPPKTRAAESGGGTARKGQDSQRDPSKAKSAKGSDSARSLVKSKTKGLPLAVGNIQSVVEEEDSNASERADALEQQIEIQKMQFEQQMNQSALAMEELFDQLTAMRKERDLASSALQRALKESKEASWAPQMPASAAALTSEGRTIEAVAGERLSAAKVRVHPRWQHDRARPHFCSTITRALPSLDHWPDGPCRHAPEAHFSSDRFLLLLIASYCF